MSLEQPATNPALNPDPATAAPIAQLDLTVNPIDLTQVLVDIPSPSHHEARIADALEQALAKIPNIALHRQGNTLVARTQRGLAQRIILAGHIDTVPIADNVPSHYEGDVLYGCGTVDMKSGLAIYAHLFATLANDPALTKDLTLICYEGEEVASQFNGLGHIQRDHPELLAGDLALLGEPSGSVIEAGCQGSIRLRITAHGTRAHSARSWLGVNAMHLLAPVISRIAAYEAQEIMVDGCLYHEGLNIVHCESGVATNTIPDHAWMFVNYRFAPDKSIDEAMAHLLDVLQLPEQVDYEVDDAVPGARPGLDLPIAQELIAAAGGEVRAKYGWTDVARFADLNIPAVNYGSGDPSLCHKKDEHIPTSMITQVATTLRAYLVGQTTA